MPRMSIAAITALAALLGPAMAQAQAGVTTQQPQDSSLSTYGRRPLLYVPGLGATYGPHSPSFPPSTVTGAYGSWTGDPTASGAGVAEATPTTQDCASRSAITGVAPVQMPSHCAP